MKELQRLQENLLQAIQLKPEQTSLLLISLPLKESLHFSKSKRLAVYQNGFYNRMATTLEEDFPRTLACIEENKKESLLCQFLEKYPSHYKSILTVSENFPIFIKRTQKKQKYLADLCQLEWLQCLATYALQRSFFDFSKLKIKNPEDIFNYKIHLCETLHLMKSSWTIHKKIQRATTYLAVFRNDQGVQVESLTMEQYHMFELLQKKDTLLSLMRKKQKLSQKSIFKFFEFLAQNQLIVDLKK